MLKSVIDHNIKSFECGPDNRIRFNNLMLLFQEAAYVNAELLGFGYSNMIKDNRAWILSNLKVELIRTPEWTENIKLVTYPTGYNRLNAFRDYIMFDEKGDRCINAISEWLAIDMDTRRPFNMNDIFDEAPDYDERAIDEKLSRINPKRISDAEKIYEVKVPYSSIDENGHVNNSEYVRWTIDALRYHAVDFEKVSSMQISFINEVFENDSCELYFKENEESIFVFGKISGKDDYVFGTQLNK